MDTRDRQRGRSMTVPDLQSLYRRHAPWCRRIDPIERAVIGPFREDHFGGLSGRILDVACGTSPNARVLSGDATYVGVDISQEMLGLAAGRLETLELDASVSQMDAQQLAFADDWFDAVISSLSTCTFPDPVAALEEMGRVCTPEGRILLFEHGRSWFPAIAGLQGRLERPYYRHTGCEWTQQPLEHVQASSLELTAARRSSLGLLYRIEAVPP